MTTWHLDDDALTRWVEGTDGAIAGASVEQHLLTCADCRPKVAAPPGLDAVWARIRDDLELPRPTRVERALIALGLDASDARVVAVSPSFRGAWLMGLALLLAFAAAAGTWGTNRGQLLFLLIAPLVPVAGVALGYDPETDPALEAECATPWSRFRLVLLRSLALLITGLPVVLGVATLVPGSISVLWLAPAAALTVVVLALSTWVAPLVASAGSAALWVLVVSSLGRGAVDDDLLGVYAGCAVAAAVVLGLRRSHLGELPWDPR